MKQDDVLNIFHFPCRLPYVQVLSVLKLDKKYEVPEGYSESFWKAIAVFHHARMYGISFVNLPNPFFILICVLK